MSPASRIARSTSCAPRLEFTTKGLLLDVIFREFCVAVDFWELPYPWKGFRWWMELATSPLRRYPYVYYVYGTAALQQKWHDLLVLPQKNSARLLYLFLQREYQ